MHLDSLFNSVPYRRVPVALSRAMERRVRRFIDEANEAFSRMEPPEELIDDATDEGFILGLGAVVERGLAEIDRDRERRTRKTETILIGGRGKLSMESVASADIAIEIDVETSTATLLKVREWPTDHYILDVVV